jgi:hypothetical protein
MRYELGFYIPEDDILRSNRREIPKSYNIWFLAEMYYRFLANADDMHFRGKYVTLSIKLRDLVCKKAHLERILPEVARI